MIFWQSFLPLFSLLPFGYYYFLIINPFFFVCTRNFLSGFCKNELIYFETFFVISIICYYEKVLFTSGLLDKFWFILCLVNLTFLEWENFCTNIDSSEQCREKRKFFIQILNYVFQRRCSLLRMLFLFNQK